MMLYQTGKTENGDLVVGGYFAFCSTHGLALEDIFLAHQKDTSTPKIVIDWSDFIISAISSGMNADSVYQRIVTSISMVYNLKEQAEFTEKLKMLFLLILKDM